MSGTNGHTFSQEKAIAELQMRVKNTLTPAIRSDPTVYYRFLKHRDFDVEKARKMIQKNIVWRKINQTDTILEDFKPCEFFTTYMEPTLLGFDKDGDMVRYTPCGTYTPFEVMQCTKMSSFMKHWYWFAENSLSLIKQENEKTGKSGYRVSMIFDLNKVSLTAVSSKFTADLFLMFITEYRDNYPEHMKASYVINAPTFFVILFSILKKIMSKSMLKKIHVYGHNGWKEKLLEVFDADLLPAFLGGNRTDPDGNPLCKTFICPGGPVLERFYLTKEDRGFKDKTRVKAIIVPPSEKREIRIEIRELDSTIHWEFFIENKDIGFGLFYDEYHMDVIEIIPMKKYFTPDGTEDNTHRCRKTGTYVIIFDNSFNWRNSKEVLYCITVVKPKL